MGVLMPRGDESRETQDVVVRVYSAISSPFPKSFWWIAYIASFRILALSPPDSNPL